MRRSIFLKIFLRYLAVCIILLAVMLFFSFRTIRDHYTHTLSDDLTDVGHALRLKVAPHVRRGEEECLRRLVNDLGAEIETRITVIDPRGVVLADSERDPETMENHRTRPEIVQAMKGRRGVSIRYSRTVEEEMLYVALPLTEDGATPGVLRLSLFLSDTNRLINRLRHRIALIAGISALIALAAAFLFARGISRPIGDLSLASSRVASGDFEARVFLKKEDSLKELADSFNYMTDQMKTGFDQLSRQKEELNSIISSLQEGLIVLDKDGKIVLNNRSFTNLVGEPRVAGRYYWEVIREPQFGEWIGRITARRRNIIEEIQLAEKVFLCSTAFLESREGVVVIFHDITKMKDLDKIKKDFVVNISHELRTPLTAIKGFAETLEEEEKDQDHLKYLDIIKRHTDRLIRIVSDLLLLSELEERGDILEIEAVDVHRLIENIMRMFEQRLQNKGLSARVETGGTVPLLSADPYRLEQLFINLIDNAIKYTEKGGITVRLETFQEGVRVIIRDTGIGISPEHLSRIFERFYVTDKSRSKRLGGTGLGLSIVKHIVLLHNGDISVDSQPGQGTTVIITLPQRQT